MLGGPDVSKTLQQAGTMSGMRYVQKCTQQQKWQKREHNGEFGKYGKNDNFARIANRTKHKAMRGPIKVGDTGEFSKYYGENDNIATIANRAKHKAKRGPIKVGDTGKFGKYGKNDKVARIANMAKHKAMRGPIKVGDTGEFGKYDENDNFATIANRPWKFTNGLIYNGY